MERDNKLLYLRWLVTVSSTFQDLNFADGFGWGSPSSFSVISA